MISSEFLENLAKQHQTSLFPNIVREYFQHVFLKELYKLPEADVILFKGGTALRIVYGSPRFSEDLDFSLCGIIPGRTQSFMEHVLVKVLAEIERMAISVEISRKSGVTSGGYWSMVTWNAVPYGPIDMEINVSLRSREKIQGEADSIAGEFIPTYSLIHMPQTELVEEKIFGALCERKKPRDFYDLYFIMRKGMLSGEQKKRLAEIKDKIVTDSRTLNFRRELGVFLPAGQQMIIRNFAHVLESEIVRQMA